MKNLVLRFLAAGLTFCFGLTCTGLYQNYVAYHQHDPLIERESTLKSDLFLMREQIQHYVVDHKGERPDSLDDLVKAGYLREVPVDPITGMKDWHEDKVCMYIRLGLVEIHSSSTAISSDGRRYNQW